MTDPEIIRVLEELNKLSCSPEHNLGKIDCDLLFSVLGMMLVFIRALDGIGESAGEKLVDKHIRQAQDEVLANLKRGACIHPSATLD